MRDIREGPYTMSTAFLYSGNEKWKNEIKQKIPFTMTSKMKILSCKLKRSIIV